MSGLAIECATEHVEVAVTDGNGATLAHEVEEVGHGHTRRLTPLVARALGEAGRTVEDLEWIAADLGPGSFTGVRVGLATAEALALASGARLVGVPSLETLAASTPSSPNASLSSRRRALIVPLVGAGRRDVYSGYFRTGGPVNRAGAGGARVLMAPRVGPVEGAIEAAREALAALGGEQVRFVGPGAARERAALERAFPGSTSPPWRFEGLSALDLAAVAPARLPGRSAAPGLRSQALSPLYVRPAQAEERVRRRALASQPLVLRPFTHDDVPAAAAIERRVFADPWTEEFFHGELGQSMVYARIAEIAGVVAGYGVAWLGAGTGHLGNLAVAPEVRRRGIARALLEDLLGRARTLDIERVALEVRGSNFPAQELYRAYGFRVAGLRRGYYRDNGEDALILEWRANT